MAPTIPSWLNRCLVSCSLRLARTSRFTPKSPLFQFSTFLHVAEPRPMSPSPLFLTRSVSPRLDPIRPPIVTIMGHVDHGKTTLLDYLRKSSVAASEAGGITQHIGAFSVRLPGSPQGEGKESHTLTFLDTPGHAAFSRMRGRGAGLTDIVILVIAADDGIMPQTIESIRHAREAKVPMIVAINKCDKFESNAERIKRDLLRYHVQVEQFGGDTQAVHISGLSGKNVDQLMHAVVALSEVLELRAPQAGPASGVVIESKMVFGKGPVATLLVQSGQLKLGSVLVCQESLCRVRLLTDALGQGVVQAGPSMPVEVTGWRSLPPVGATVVEVEDEKTGTHMIHARKTERELSKCLSSTTHAQRASKASEPALTLLDSKPLGHHEIVSSKIKVQSEFITRDNEVNVLLITDVVGSQEALQSALSDLPNDRVALNILRSTIGEVTQGDIEFAAMTHSRILTFNVRPSKAAKSLAEKKKVAILSYDIIYRLIDDVMLFLTERLPNEYSEKVSGIAEIAQVFELNAKDPNECRVAGCIVRDGFLKRDNDPLTEVRVQRQERVIYTGRIKMLKYLKKDIATVSKGMECGIMFEDFIDFESGDTILYVSKLLMKKTL